MHSFAIMYVVMLNQHFDGTLITSLIKLCAISIKHLHLILTEGFIIIIIIITTTTTTTTTITITITITGRESFSCHAPLLGLV